MKAIVYHRYGSAEELELAELPVPTPRADEVLVRILATSLNGSDREGLTGQPLYARIGGLRAPRHPILGSDIAGVVEAVGPNHTEFKPGDEVFGELPGYRNGLAQYACTHGRTLLRKPATLSFEQAAAIPQGGTIAYNGIIRQGKVQRGQSVLINGAGGSGGSFAIQLAKLQGAEVTGVDNGHKLDFMRAQGADRVIDYTREDFTTGGERYDLILDLTAYRPVTAGACALRRGGTYYVVGGALRYLLQVLLLGPLISRTRGKQLRLLVVPQNRDDLSAISALCESGAVKPAIDRVFPLEQGADAFRYILAGRSRGKVVIEVG